MAHFHVIRFCIKHVATVYVTTPVSYAELSVFAVVCCQDANVDVQLDNRHMMIRGKTVSLISSAVLKMLAFIFTPTES